MIPSAKVKNVVIEKTSADSWRLFINDKELKSPKGNSFMLPNEKLATIIADEWRRQDRNIRPDQMPFYQFAATAIDIVNADRGTYIAELSRFGETDLLCYRSESDPVLAARQRQLWQPLLQWLRDEYQTDLKITSGIIAIKQPDIYRLHTILLNWDHWHLAVLGIAVANLGSLALGAAFCEGRLWPDEAHHLSCLDELYQEERWGKDEDAVQKRSLLEAELVALRSFLDCIKAE